jgi:hypothetical protein
MSNPDFRSHSRRFLSSMYNAHWTYAQWALYYLDRSSVLLDMMDNRS